jgi:hypothetical protein
MILPQLAKHSTRFPRTIWIKLPNGPATKLKTKACWDIYDLCTAACQEFNIKRQISIHIRPDQEHIRSGLAIGDLLKLPEFVNSDEAPIIVKILPESTASKTIYLRQSTSSGRFTSTYMQVTVRNDSHVRLLIRNHVGLVHSSEPDTVILGNLNSLEDGEKYYLYDMGENYSLKQAIEEEKKAEIWDKEMRDEED